MSKWPEYLDANFNELAGSGNWLDDIKRGFLEAESIYAPKLDQSERDRSSANNAVANCHERIVALEARLDEQQRNWERDLDAARRELDRASEASMTALIRERNEAVSRLDALSVVARDAWNYIRHLHNQVGPQYPGADVCNQLAAFLGPASDPDSPEYARIVESSGRPARKPCPHPNWLPFKSEDREYCAMCGEERERVVEKGVSNCAGCQDRNDGKPFSWDRPHICADYADEDE